MSSLSSQDPPLTCLELQLASKFVSLAARAKTLGSEVRLTQALESSLASLGLLLALRDHSSRATLAWPATGLPSRGQHIRNSSSCLAAQHLCGRQHTKRLDSIAKSGRSIATKPSEPAQSL